MNIYCRLSNHTFENRLYIWPDSRCSPRNSIDAQKKDHFCDNLGIEQRGLSCRSYSRPLGWLLSLIGISSAVTVNGNRLYINNGSFTKYCIRYTDCKSRVQDAFNEYEKKGYPQTLVEHVNNYVKQVLKLKPKLDASLMWTILEKARKLKYDI